MRYNVSVKEVWNMKIKEKINQYLKQLGYSEQDLNFFDSASVYVAQQIAMYAHRGQKRVNGDAYFSHPFNVMQLYRDFVGIDENDYFCINVDLLVGECKIPYDGVQEVCLLHDVLEDTDVTLFEIEQVFTDLSLGHYFQLYIKTPLQLMTHDENEEYDVYIARLINNPTASLVKFLDLTNNMNPSTLDIFGQDELNRIIRYAGYAKFINDKWHFTENRQKYKKLFKREI